MSRRIVVGRRNNGDHGVFVSRPGHDAFTAADNDLILSINRKVSALLLMGYIGSSGWVTLGYGARPIVILSSIRSVTGITGLSRPSPLFYGYHTTPSAQHCFANVQPDGSSMYIQALTTCRYEVYNESAP